MNLAQAKVTRWLQILTSLDSHGFMTTSQLQRLHNLGGRRNTNRILNDMNDLLSSFQLEEKVYYLSAKGRKEIGSTTTRRRTLHTQHTLLRNEVYLHYHPEYWRVEFPIKWADKAIIPDAIFKRDGQFVFLEVDNTQAMTQNEKKIALYRELRETQIFQKKHGLFPTILYVTISEYRKKNIRALLDGMKAEVITYNDLK
ncbi:replication-relaxation family protein [Paenibacillus sp. MCAF9]|uniref:replication-relaxation family protein n=1 Tax=Paenibacillus sp. MCAF9 TaxID=3233046 RepID=UPI003F9A2C3D